MTRHNSKKNGFSGAALLSHRPTQTTLKSVISEKCVCVSASRSKSAPKRPTRCVCASYPWASFALVFADGCAHWTALPQTRPGGAHALPGGAS